MEEFFIRNFSRDIMHAYLLQRTQIAITVPETRSFLATKDSSKDYPIISAEPDLLVELGRQTVILDPLNPCAHRTLGSALCRFSH